MNPVRNNPVKSPVFKRDADTQEASRISNRMRILIGTPIHECKDYSMERWLKNVADLTSHHPADLLLVDNSPGISYVNAVEKYCQKYSIKNYIIKHLEIDQKFEPDIRIESSQELIRQYVLSHGYDGWFSWECDQIIPNNALDKLVKIMQEGAYMMVIHDSGARWDWGLTNTNMGVTLIHKSALRKARFLPFYNIHTALFKKRVLASGGNYLEVFGLIKAILHLDK